MWVKSVEDIGYLYVVPVILVGILIYQLDCIIIAVSVSFLMAFSNDVSVFVDRAVLSGTVGLNAVLLD